MGFVVLSRGVCCFIAVCIAMLSIKKIESAKEAQNGAFVTVANKA